MRMIPSDIKRKSNNFVDNGYEYIHTDKRRAKRLFDMIGRYGSSELQQMTSDGFLTCMPSKEKDILVLIFKALKYGAVVAERYDDEHIKRIHEAIQDLYREAQSCLSSLSMTDVENNRLAILNPRNDVLPIISHTVMRREAGVDVALYDKRHNTIYRRHDGIESVIDLYEMPHNEIKNAYDLYEQLQHYKAS